MSTLLLKFIGIYYNKIQEIYKLAFTLARIKIEHDKNFKFNYL